MMIGLRLSNQLHRDLMDHLLRDDDLREQSAFLFATTLRAADGISFDVIAHRFLGDPDYVAQETDYLELADETRASLIKAAHDSQTSLIEVHSHPGPWPAEFSLADKQGLEETVPHMWWRLRGRPYAAIVVAKSGFDALVWVEGADEAVGLDWLMAGDRLLRPTNRSLRWWNGG